MPIAKEANQRIEFFRAKRFLAEPEPEKEPVVVLPGETTILNHANASLFQPKIPVCGSMDLKQDEKRSFSTKSNTRSTSPPMR